MREQYYFWDARLPMCTPLAVDLTSLTSCLPLLSFRSCEISCTWKCLTAWRTKRNPQLPHWGWTVTTVILQHSTTAPNHSPWPPKRRIRKPGFALSSQEEGIKVKYQWPGIQKGPVYSFFVAFFFLGSQLLLSIGCSGPVWPFHLHLQRLPFVRGSRLIDFLWDTRKYTCCVCLPHKLNL